MSGLTPWLVIQWGFAIIISIFTVIVMTHAAAAFVKWVKDILESLW